jgi:thiamine kinase-like enzyme
MKRSGYKAAMPTQKPAEIKEDVDLEQLIAAVPMLAQRPLAGWRVARLPGLTNRSWRLTDDALDVVLRAPGRSADRYLTRANEFHNAGMAARLGIAPPLFYADPRSGIMVQEYLADATQLQQSDFADPGTASEIGALLARLHASSEPFMGTMAPFPVIDLYLSLASDARLRDLRKRMDPIRQALEARPEPPLPSHIDPNPSNFLRLPDGSLRLIDWEFSAMCEPAWDLAAVMIEADLAPDASDAVLAGYGGENALSRHSRLWLMRAALHLVAGSWTYAEIAGGNTAPGLPALLEHYLSGLERMMDSSERLLHLRVAQD